MESKDQWKTKRPSINYDGRTKEQLKPGEVFNQASYFIVSGTSEISHNMQKNIELLISSKNKYGEKVKVILGSKTIAEGLDFKRLRQSSYFRTLVSLKQNGTDYR